MKVLSIDYNGFEETPDPKLSKNLIPIYAPVHIKKLCNDFDVLPNNKYQGYCGWVKVQGFIPPHRDETGNCLLYVAEGHGDFYTKSLHVRCFPGIVLLFNDRCLHLWNSDEPVKMLIVSIRIPKTTDLPHFPYYVEEIT